MLACLALATAQVAVLLEFLLIPAPTPETRGPQGPLDEALGLLAIAGSVSGVLLAPAGGVLGVQAANARGARSWSRAILAASAISVLAFIVLAFVLLGSGRSPVHPFVVFIPIPLVALAYGLVGVRSAGEGPA
jgi:hypothetical protein